MQQISLKEKTASTVLHQFIFPFSIRKAAYAEMKHDLQLKGFCPFQLTNTELEHEYYGSHYQVSHREMEHMFLPFTNQFLFPIKADESLSFQRYSKKIDLDCEFYMPDTIIPFRIHSVDVILCPYEIGMLTIRTELEQDVSYSQGLEFAKRFRTLENLEPEDEVTYVKTEHAVHREIVSFCNDELFPGLFDWMDQEENDDNVFANLPFFINERMFTIALYGLDADETVTNADLFRAVRLNGLDSKGQPYIGSSNADYIANYVHQRVYDRWAPSTYHIADEHVLSCVTNETNAVVKSLASKMFGSYYYAFLLNLFHKIVLLKLSNHYGRLRLDRNRERVEDLIRGITLFSSRFYYREMVAESQLHDIFHLLRRLHGNDELLKDVKLTLSALYDYQSNATSKRSDYILTVLTIFTVISGIYGMNQVIEDLKAPIDWTKALHYSLFEYLALAVTFTGISVSIVLAITTLTSISKEYFRRKKRQ